MGAHYSKITDDDGQVYNVTPLSIGIDSAYSEMLVTIPKNTRIPTSKTSKFEVEMITTSDNQKSAHLAIYQGERRKASDNQLLGKLVFTGIPRAPMGVTVVTVSLDVDAKGNLNVSARDESTGQELASMRISGVGVEGKLMSAEEVEMMARQGEKNKSEDEEYLRRMDVLKALQAYTNVVRENAAAGGYSKKAYRAFVDVAGKMLDEFKEKAKEFGVEGHDMNKCASAT